MKTQTQNQPISRCLMCKRAMSNPESITRGIGSECAEKLAAALSACSVSDAEMSVWENAGEQPAHWSRLLLKAIAARRLRDARQFVDAARRALPAPVVAPAVTAPAQSGLQYVRCGQLSGHFYDGIAV